MSKRTLRAAWLALILAIAPLAWGESPSAPTWASYAASQYEVVPNVTYLVAGGREVKLDIYKRRNATALQPTMIYFHGGGWVRSSKESVQMALIPWLEMGWNVVNVEYRLGPVAVAPAAVEDALCALRFIATEAKTYGVDANQLVVSGESSGAHLALTTGMIPESAGLGRECQGVPLPRVAAIIEWYGFWDVGDLLDGANRKPYAVQWLSSAQNREEVARRVSPMSYVRGGLPPVLAIQGELDTTAVQHSMRLDEALTKAGVQHELVTVPHGGHGNFPAEERAKIYVKIREFLAKNSLGKT